ncbi:MAG: prolipoprotein diacylglyceryl transferase [bacterium]
MHPILFQLGPIKIYAYGTMLSIAFLIGIYKTAFDAEKEGIKKDYIFDLGFYCVLSAIVGARLLYIIVNYKFFLENPLEIIFFHHGGLVYYGGLIGAFTVSYIYIKKHNLQTWQISDLIAPYLALGIGVTRIGCFLNGCCFGKETNSYLGISCGADSLAGSFFGKSVVVHPTQLYEFTYCFLLFILLLVFKKYKKFHGQLFWLFILSYSILRGINEIFRGDGERGIYWIFSTSQWIGIFTGLAAIIMLSKLRKNKIKFVQ